MDILYCFLLAEGKIVAENEISFLLEKKFLIKNANRKIIFNNQKCRESGASEI